MRTWVKVIVLPATLGMLCLASCASSGSAGQSSVRELPGVTPHYETAVRSHWRQHRKPARDDRARALAAIAEGAERLSSNMISQNTELQLAAETPDSHTSSGALAAALQELKVAAERGNLSDVRVCYARALELYAAR